MKRKKPTTAVTGLIDTAEHDFAPQRLLEVPFRCPNCDGVAEDANVFCSELCENKASFVRYHRACLEDGRYEDPDVRLALRMRLAFLVVGGYSERDRRVPLETRKQVIARDRGLCRSCGATGTDIDHIHGSSNEIVNLQLLCKNCHDQKTERSIMVAPAEEFPVEAAIRDELLARSFAAKPDRPSDDPIVWKLVSRLVSANRRRLISERRLRRCGKRCPVCLALLPKNPESEYRCTGERRMRCCDECFAKRVRDVICLECGAEAVWLNLTMAACQACGSHGAKDRIAGSAA
jgi:hypothetical protein